MVTALPIIDDRFLDHIQIAKPCDASWDGMKGDALVRRCGDCELDVYNISSLTRAEAAALIRSREGRLCIRMFMRPDGTLITRDCDDVMRRARRRGLATFGAVLSMVVISGFIAHKCGAEITETKVEPQHIERTMMGAPPPTPMMGEPSVVELKGDISEAPQVELPKHVLMGKIAAPTRHDRLK
jgi:hypothetical protein